MAYNAPGWMPATMNHLARQRAKGTASDLTPGSTKMRTGNGSRNRRVLPTFADIERVKMQPQYVTMAKNRIWSKPLKTLNLLTFFAFRST